MYWFVSTYVSAKICELGQIPQNFSHPNQIIPQNSINPLQKLAFYFANPFFLFSENPVRMGPKTALSRMPVSTALTPYLLLIAINVQIDNRNNRYRWQSGNRGQGDSAGIQPFNEFVFPIQKGGTVCNQPSKLSSRP